MSHPFAISRSLSSVLSDPDLHDLIRRHTGSVGEADSIVRSIRRFGDDSSIEHYDLTPKQGTATRYHTRAVTWSVRAIRPMWNEG